MQHTKCLIGGVQDKDFVIQELQRQLAQQGREHSQALAAFETERADWEVCEKVSFTLCLCLSPVPLTFAFQCNLVHLGSGHR